MKRGNLEKTNCLYNFKGRKIKIIGISCSKRNSHECAREDPTSLELLKIALKEAEKLGAEKEIIDLRELKINTCNECYSTCPAQCRFNEKTYQCDCYLFKHDTIFVNEKEFYPIEEAYDKLTKKEFFEKYFNKGTFARRDDMWIVYKKMLEADGVIFSTSTSYYSRNALLQSMLSRFCALDGGVEKIWGDGKNLGNSIKYSSNKTNTYKMRLYGRQVGFINVSKEGDSVTPDLMKACTMMGMKIIPLGVSYHVQWYNDPTHRKDKSLTLEDPYTLQLTKHLGKKIVEEVKQSNRTYGALSKVV